MINFYSTDYLNMSHVEKARCERGCFTGTIPIFYENLKDRGLRIGKKGI